MRCVFVWCSIAVLAAPASARAQSAIAGQWEGTAALPGGDLTVRFDVTPTDSGIAAVMDIPESKLIRFPVPEARFVNGELVLAVPPGWGLAMFRDIGLAPEEQVIRFAGRLLADSVAGRLRIAYADLPLVLHRFGPAAQPYRVEDVRFSNGDVVLAGSLFLPMGRGRFSVLLFTHGSGDRTRDSYRYEAERLASSGIAALVYDKRGAGQSVGANWTVATFDELAGDAAAGVQYLRGRPDINPGQIGLFGLSQGTWLIGMTAMKTPVGFLIFASGSGIPVWEQELYRTKSMMRVEGFSESEAAEAEAYERLGFAVGRTGIGWARFDSTTRALQARGARWFKDFGQAYASLSSARFWWLAAWGHDPTPILEQITVPVLGLFGENDLSFPTPTVTARMSAAFRHARNCDVTLHVFPSAEHQLMVPQRYGDRVLRRVVTPELLPLMTAWIQRHVAGATMQAATDRCP
jgi:pimeloyl-ACP methyl ester carboxylesterase